MSLPGSISVVPTTVDPDWAFVPTPLLQQMAVGIAPGMKSWTTTEYHKLIEQGIIPEGAPIELINGALVYKDRRDAKDDVMPYGPKHASAVYQLTQIGLRLGQHGCFMLNQMPVILDDTREPEPDGCIVRGTIDSLKVSLPHAADVLLVVEVSASSLEYDRSTKLQMYASSNIPAYWIVNLRQNVIEEYGQPDAKAGIYLFHRDHAVGDTLHINLPSGFVFDVGVDEIIG